VEGIEAHGLIPDKKKKGYQLEDKNRNEHARYGTAQGGAEMRGDGVLRDIYGERSAPGKILETKQSRDTD